MQSVLPALHTSIQFEGQKSFQNDLNLMGNEANFEKYVNEAVKQAAIGYSVTLIKEGSQDCALEFINIHLEECLEMASDHSDDTDEEEEKEQQEIEREKKEQTKSLFEEELARLRTARGGGSNSSNNTLG